MAKECGPCPDEENYVEVSSGDKSFQVSLPQVYFHPPVKGHPLQALQITVPPSTQRKDFQRPVFGDDGSIEYPRLSSDTTPPDDIDGYVRDPENPWRFTPIWDHCKLRGQGTRMKLSGCIDIAMACNNPESEHFAKPVKCADCKACPVRKE